MCCKTLLILLQSISSADSETGPSQNKRIKAKWTKSTFLSNKKEPSKPTGLSLIRLTHRP